jgi:hypothetical protein
VKKWYSEVDSENHVKCIKQLVQTVALKQKSLSNLLVTGLCTVENAGKNTENIEIQRF